MVKFSGDDYLRILAQKMKSHLAEQPNKKRKEESVYEENMESEKIVVDLNLK